MKHSIILILTAICCKVSLSWADCLPDTPTEIEPLWTSPDSASRHVVRLTIDSTTELATANCKVDFVFDIDQQEYIETDQFRVYTVVEVFRSDKLTVGDKIMVVFSTDTGLNIDLPAWVIGNDPLQERDGFLAFLDYQSLSCPGPSVGNDGQPTALFQDLYYVNECISVHGPWSGVSASDRALLRGDLLSTTTTCPLDALANSLLPEGFCAFEIPVSIGRPRGVIAVGTSHVLVLERDTQSIVFLEDTDSDGIPDARRSLSSATGLNHGLVLHDGYIYASSQSIVYRWPYSDNDQSLFADIGTVEIVIDNISRDSNGDSPGGHTTRTLVFDSLGRLYVSVGSNRNVDPDSFRSRIRRFSDLSPSLFPIDFRQGEVFADGVRNEVGLAFDRHGVLWGVENGADNLRRSDLGGDITNDNPAEELNRFPEEIAGSHFGYPFCWTEYLLPEQYGLGRGTVWAWPTFLNSGAATDEDCRNNYVGPEVSMQAHSAPLGIVFYEYKEVSERPPECLGGAFPRDMDGFAFIAFHGSWNRDIPTGYKVVYVEMDQNGRAIGQPIDLLANAGPGARWPDGFR